MVLNLDGDGRCDNPGHSAKYGTYTLMDEDIGNVVTFQVVQVTKGPSNSMEKEGFTRCIELLGGKISPSIGSQQIAMFHHQCHGQRSPKHQTPIRCKASLKVGGKEADSQSKSKGM